jgi:hypothetical protein
MYSTHELMQYSSIAVEFRDAFHNVILIPSRFNQASVIQFLHSTHSYPNSLAAITAAASAELFTVYCDICKESSRIPLEERVLLLVPQDSRFPWQ